MAKTNISISFLIKPSEKNADDLVPIYCRFKVANFSKKEISMNIRIKEEQWDNSQSTQRIIPIKGMYKAEKEIVASQNQAMADLRAKIWATYNQLVVTHKHTGTVIDTLAVKENLKESYEVRTFTDCKNELLQKIKKSKESCAKANIVCEHFANFLKEELKSEFLVDIQNKNGLSAMFHDYCINTLVWKGSYIKKMLNYVRACFRIAKEKKWITQDIPLVYNFGDSAYTLKEYLTADELKKIIDEKFATESLQRSADLFLFQCYTGLAYVDMRKITYEDIKETDGQFYLRDFRQKSKTEYNIPLLKIAVDIIEKYRHNADRIANQPDKALPVKANGGYNLRLKCIMDAVGINKSISSHCARYTCNMLLFEAGVQDEVRKHILGHTTVAMTAHYTHKRPEVLRDAMNKIG
jgi:integrase